MTTDKTTQASESTDEDQPTTSQCESMIGNLSDPSNDSAPTTETMTTSDRTAESDQSGARPLSRRGLLKGAASAAVGVTGMSAISGTAAACTCDGHYHDEVGEECDYPAAPGWFGHLGMSPGDEHNLPWGTTNLVIFIHGFNTKRYEALNYGNSVWQKLRDKGYPGDSFAFLWPSLSKPWQWGSAKANANEAGIWLANWLMDNGYISRGNVRIHLVCHSLGARVALECLRHFHLGYNAGNVIDTVHLLGGAVYDRAVGGYYRGNIEFSCRKLHNWHSEYDKVLKRAFRAAEGGRWAVGWRGIASGPVPANYYDMDVSYSIDKHCQYMDYHTGIIGGVRETMRWY